jgi:acetylornithine deacetylase/succinyl-diaminopimelate desuccinylase-like protein
MLSRRRHPLLGKPTINVGAIHGGSQANIVPDRCEILIDRRTIPPERDAQVRSEIRDFLRQNGLRFQFESAKVAVCPPLETDTGLPLVREFFRAAGQRRAFAVDFFCDAAILASGGIPSVVFGPGNIAQAHTRDEWVELGSLNRAADLLKRFLTSLP